MSFLQKEETKEAVELKRIKKALLILAKEINIHNTVSNILNGKIK